MGINNGKENENSQEPNTSYLQSFSNPYSPTFYLNSKIYDSSATIQSVMNELLKENKNTNQDQEKKEEKKQTDIFPKTDSIIESNSTQNSNKENVDDETTNKPLIYKSSSLEKDIRDFYKFKDFLGEGHFASVRTAYKRREFSSHKIFAVKSISLKKLTEKEYLDLLHEVEIISHLEHPYVIKFYETFHDQHYFHLITELCRGNSLDKRLKKCGGKMKEEHVRIIILKILHAIKYCHSFGVVHRDLKPENIVFESPNNEYHEEKEEDENNRNFNIKIIDFGLSALKKKTEKLHTILGTPYYMAPEVLKGDYNEECDIWSIGAIAYYLLTGTEAFTGDTSNKIFAKILYTEPDYNPQKFRNVSTSAIDFIKKCFIKDPDKRFNAKEGLNHQWFEPLFKKIYAPKFVEDAILYNLSNMKKYSRLKKLIIKYMIFNMGHTELGFYKRAFLAFDKDNSGVIRPEELKNLFNIYHKPLSEEQIKNIMSVSEENNDFLTYHEFIICCLRIRDFLSPKKLFDAFLYFDIDENNIIDSNDIYLTLLRWGKDVTDKNDIEKIIFLGTGKKFQKLDLNAFVAIFSEEINIKEYIDQINDIKKKLN